MSHTVPTEFFANPQEIGHGPLGRSWRAQDMRTGSDVLVKEILGTSAQRFAIREHLAEQQIHAAALGHAGIVLLTVVKEEPDCLWLMREFLEAEPLALTLVDHSLTSAGIYDFMEELGRALQLLRKLGLTHGHCALTNLFVLPNGSIRLTDPGLCPSLDDIEREKPGHLVFYPPERFDAAPADPRDDSYAVGVLFYSLIAGMPPLAMTDPAALRATLRRGLLPLPENFLPENRQDERLLLESLLEPVIEERLVAPREIVATFDGIGALRHLPARPAAPAHPSPRVLIWLSVSMLVLIVGWLMYFRG